MMSSARAKRPIIGRAQTVSSSADAVTSMGRAVALRAALVFGPLVMLMGIVAASPGYKPLAVFLVFFGVFGLFGLVLFTRTDRKLMAVLGKPDAPWAGAYASALPVDTGLSPETALGFASMHRPTPSQRRQDDWWSHRCRLGWFRVHQCPSWASL